MNKSILSLTCLLTSLYALSMNNLNLSKIKANNDATINKFALYDGSILFRVENNKYNTNFTNLYYFKGNNDGVSPYNDLIMDANNNLYGITLWGGGSVNCDGGCGTVFQLSKDDLGNWSEKIIYSFQGITDGNYPNSLIMDKDGNLYGTTQYGGGNTNCWGGCGTVFQLNKDNQGNWSYHKMYTFQGADSGGLPSNLTLDNNGNIFGFNLSCVNLECGSVFELNKDIQGNWNEKLIYSSQIGNFSTMLASLIIDSNENLYFTLNYAADGGKIVQLSKDNEGNWISNILYSFNNGQDGYYPTSLLLDVQGNIYGLTIGGGNMTCGNGCGTIYQLSKDSQNNWSKKIIYLFQANDINSPFNITNDSNGNFIGVSRVGGYDNVGTIFQLTKNNQGELISQVLYSFQPGNSLPQILIVDANNNIYGTTNNGGDTTSYPNGCGTIFEVMH